MSRSLRNRLTGVLLAGLLGGIAVLVVGPIQPPDREGRLVVDAAYLGSVRDAAAAELGREPDPGELARALEERIDGDMLLREARVRGLLPAGERTGVETSEVATSGPVLHLRRVAATRWLTAPPTDAEVVAFVELRRDRYAARIPGERGLPPAGDVLWEEDPGLARLLTRARADVGAAERRASANQFLAEIAPHHPIALSRGARRVLDAGDGPGSTGGEVEKGGTDTPDGGPVDRPEPTAPGPAAPDPAGRSSWSLDPEDPWSGAASVFLEEAGEGRYDLTVLLPPGTADDAARVVSACGADRDRTVLPVFPSDAGTSDLPWRVANGTLRCPAGMALEDDVLEISAPPGVRGDLEFRRLDGAAFVSTFQGGGAAMDLSLDGAPSAIPVREARAGFVDVLGILALWLLALTLGALRPGARALGLAAAAFGLGYALGRWTAGTGGPTTVFGVPELLTLLAAALLAVAWPLPRPRTAGGSSGPPVVLFGLLGLLFGGTVAASFAAALFPANRWIDTGTGLGGAIAGGTGAALALVPMLATGVGLSSIIPRLGRASASDGSTGLREPLVGRVLGAAAVAGIVALVYSAFVAFPPRLPDTQLQAWLLAAALGAVLALSGVRLEASALGTAGLLVLAGLALPAIDGWGGYSASFLSGTLVAGCLFAAGLLGLGAAAGGGAKRHGRHLLGVAALASLAVGLHLSWATGPSGGTASSSALGGAAVALTLGWLVFQTAAAVPAPSRTRALRGVALGAVALAVAIRLPDYLGSLADSVRADLAFGRLPIPLLALVLGILALVQIPRRRRVVDALGLQRRPRRLHLWLGAAAFLLLPFGLLQVPVPVQAGSVPAEDDARRIVGQLLTDTYEAFELADEEALYDRLAETVTGELLPTLFLENRRGLASGADDATEVSVLDVAVAPGGAVSEGTGAGRAFTWTGEWAVRARVAHLVHVHLRENLYTGRINVVGETEGWKLDAVELTAEERVARPWGGS